MVVPGSSTTCSSSELVLFAILLNGVVSPENRLANSCCFRDSKLRHNPGTKFMSQSPWNLKSLSRASEHLSSGFHVHFDVVTLASWQSLLIDCHPWNDSHEKVSPSQLAQFLSSVDSVSSSYSEDHRLHHHLSFDCQHNPLQVGTPSLTLPST